jgi:hypothetical protein
MEDRRWKMEATALHPMGKKRERCQMGEGRWKMEASEKRRERRAKEKGPASDGGLPAVPLHIQVGNNRGRRIRGFPAPVGAQIQSGHLEHLLPVLKEAFSLGDQVGDIGRVFGVVFVPASVQ